MKAIRTKGFLKGHISLVLHLDRPAVGFGNFRSLLKANPPGSISKTPGARNAVLALAPSRQPGGIRLSTPPLAPAMGLPLGSRLAEGGPLTRLGRESSLQGVLTREGTLLRGPPPPLRIGRSPGGRRLS